MLTKSSKPILTFFLGVLLTSGACRATGEDELEDGGTASSPSVLSTGPLGGASGVPINAHISVTFSEAMDPTTLTRATRF